jgi:hypothetical protein
VKLPDQATFVCDRTTASSSSLGVLERQAVICGLTDPLSSIAHTSWLVRQVSLIFGGRPVNRLADPQLEAIRQYAVLARLRPQLVSDMERVLKRLGFSAEQVSALRRLCGEASGALLPTERG